MSIGDSIPVSREQQMQVYCSFSCEEVAEQYFVSRFDATEELNRPYRTTVELKAVEDHADAFALLGKNVRLSFDRSGYERRLLGLVSRVSILDYADIGKASLVEIVPALSTLALTHTSRIFQDKNALEIIETVLREGLALYGRTIDTELLTRDRYLTRDYCVQYQETNFDFVQRLMEEEGIGYYFEFENGEREQLVLFDANAHLRRVQTMDGQAVRFDATNRDIVVSEPVVKFEPSLKLAPTQVTVRDHDWTQRAPRVERSVGALGPLPGERPHEVYLHGHAQHLTIREDNLVLQSLIRMAQSAAIPGGVLPIGIENIVHNLPSVLFDSLTSDNSGLQAQIRSEIPRRDVHTACGNGRVIGFSPGRFFDLIGHPTLGADGRYLLTKVTHSNSASDENESGAGSAGPRVDYLNCFECLPVNVAWRPDRKTRKPRIYGVQTATVTGPIGMDVYTDAYGRIQVKFPWDRSPDALTGNNSCWLRVAQTWAGNGLPGFMFIPRVGMEVIVSFVEGDPDRPLVIGCVYNGRNVTPNMLPVQATRSIIRTQTVPHISTERYNELSFEDAMGMERVHVRAQRDLDELVLNNHQTRVERDQHNSVGSNQFEDIGGNQWVRVDRNRTKTVAADEIETTVGNHSHTVVGSSRMQVGMSYHLSVQHGSVQTRVPEGEWVAESRGRLALAQGMQNFIVMTAEEEHEHRGVLIESRGTTIHLSDEKIELKIGDSKLEIDGGDEQEGGSVHLRLPSGKALSVEIGGAPVFKVSKDGSGTKIDLGGNADERLVLGDSLKTLLNEFFQKYDTHTHPTPAGPSSPPLPAFTQVRVTDAQLSNIARTKRS